MSSTDNSLSELRRLAGEICEAVRQAFGATLSAEAERTLFFELRRMPDLSSELGAQVFIECAEEERPLTDESFQRVVWRVCKRTVREACRHVQADLEAIEATVSAPSTVTGSAQSTVEDLRELLGTLTPEELCMIQCRVFEEMSVAATAKQLGLSPHTFTRCWSSLMETMRRKLS